MTEHLFLVVGLLVAGYLLIAVEVFVVPGFGVPGIAGLVCLGVACFLAFRFLGATAGGGLVVGVLALTTVIAVLLPKTPLGRWMVHRGDLSAARMETTGLTVGDEGITESVLRPSGVVRFGDRRESVVSHGEFIERGVFVTIVRLEGPRIVVERADFEDEVTGS